jgi:hypothetical protein
VASANPSIESKLDAIAGRTEGGRRGAGGGRGGPAGPANLSTVRSQPARLEHEIEAADMGPTTAQSEACRTVAKPLAGLLNQWQQLKQTDLKALNEQLQRAHLGELALDSHKIGPEDEDQIDMGDDE